jgi:hypothetical protein
MIKSFFNDQYFSGQGMEKKFLFSTMGKYNSGEMRMSNGKAKNRIVALLVLW